MTILEYCQEISNNTWNPLGYTVHGFAVHVDDELFKTYLQVNDPSFLFLQQCKKIIDIDLVLL